jgi:poly-gamma-glutamate synthesis protein (capsule biosynthesis protein)
VLVVTGDVIPARQTNLFLTQKGNFAYSWDATSALLKSGDIDYLNLEAPLIEGCPVSGVGMTFCGNAKFADGMVAATKNLVVNIANNHIGNYGTLSIAATEDLLRSQGVEVSGLTDLAVQNIRGVRFSFAGLNGVGQPVDQVELKREIQILKQNSDIVVVQFHWGKEYETYPFSAGGVAPDDPRTIGKMAIDDGADIVIGNHPHCVQGSEWYKGKLITYAHGNFIFDQDWSQGTQEGAIGFYYFYGTQLVATRYLPLRIVGDMQPQPLDVSSGEGRTILDRMARSSRELLGLSAPIRPDLNDANQACL